MQIEFFRNPLFSVLFLAAVPFLFASRAWPRRAWERSHLGIFFCRLMIITGSSRIWTGVSYSLADLQSASFNHSDIGPFCLSGYQLCWLGDYVVIVRNLNRERYASCPRTVPLSWWEKQRSCLGEIMYSNKLSWGGRIRTYEWRSQNPQPYHLATPQHLISW